MLSILTFHEKFQLEGLISLPVEFDVQEHAPWKMNNIEEEKPFMVQLYKLKTVF